MKLFVYCFYCVREEKGKIYEFQNVEMENEGIYRLKCDNGHEYEMVTQNPHFEILFDMGALALLDGYTREAVSSFASTLERFYEYCIKVFLLKNKIKKEQIEATWKQVSKQSERQLGAFYFLYLNEFNEGAPKFNQKMTEFRNNVIHNGYIPKTDEVIKYAKTIFDYITDITPVLREKYDDFLDYPVLERKAKLNWNHAHTTIPTILYTVNDNGVTFEEGLENLRARMKTGYFR